MSNKYSILAAVCLGTVLSSYVSSCINIALPNIMQALNFNMDSVVWVSLSYMLPYGSTLPLTGKLGDQFGAKRVYLMGLSIFTVASFICGLSTNAGMMIVFRVIQGVGAGMLLPNAMSVVARTFEPHERGQALGIWSAMAAAGSAMGPTIGGYLIEHFDWRSIFFSVIPFCLVSIAFAFAVIPKFEKKAGTEPDYIGAGLLIASISSLLMALNNGQREGWDSLYITLLFYGAAASFILFVLVELRVQHPMIDLTLFYNINFTIANLVGFLSFVAMYGGMFLLPFFLKSILHYDSITAGLMLMPMTATMVFFAPVGGRVADRFGSRLPAFLGILLVAGSLRMFNTINADYSGHEFFTRLVLMGIGLGFTMSPLSNCAIASLPKDKIGVGSGVFNLSKIIGGSIGVVLVETILSNREKYHYQVLNEALNPASHSPEELSALLRGLWGREGMDGAMIAEAAHGWFTGRGFLPHQYTAFKGILAQMIQRQATILSFEDVFYTLSLLCFCGAVCSLFIRKNQHARKEIIPAKSPASAEL